MVWRHPYTADHEHRGIVASLDLGYLECLSDKFLCFWAIVEVDTLVVFEILDAALVDRRFTSLGGRCDDFEVVFERGKRVCNFWQIVSDGFTVESFVGGRENEED